jgi:hypothetical protein
MPYTFLAYRTRYARIRQVLTFGVIVRAGGSVRENVENVDKKQVIGFRYWGLRNWDPQSRR